MVTPKLNTWVLSPQSIGGLDHLGTQAPCVLTSSQLIPGITIEFFRRADRLFTLISERHGVAMVGRVQLLPALDRLEAGELLSLSQYTAQDSPYHYFKNPMGGLSQYYAGTLSDLDLISSQTKPLFQYTKEQLKIYKNGTQINVSTDNPDQG